MPSFGPVEDYQVRKASQVKITPIVVVGILVFLVIAVLEKRRGTRVMQEYPDILSRDGQRIYREEFDNFPHGPVADSGYPFVATKDRVLIDSHLLVEKLYANESVWPHWNETLNN